MEHLFFVFKVTAWRSPLYRINHDHFRVSEQRGGKKGWAERQGKER